MLASPSCHVRWAAADGLLLIGSKGDRRRPARDARTKTRRRKARAGARTKPARRPHEAHLRGPHRYLLAKILCHLDRRVPAL